MVTSRTAYVEGFWLTNPHLLHVIPVCVVRLPRTPQQKQQTKHSSGYVYIQGYWHAEKMHASNDGDYMSRPGAYTNRLGFINLFQHVYMPCVKLQPISMLSFGIATCGAMFRK